MTPIRDIRLLVAYDGTDFAGWQRQADDRSVQGEIERALADLHGEPTGILGAGRTDSGVHATGQVASFKSPLPGIPADKYAPALNSRLPRDVRIMESREAPEGFHARFDARSRLYRFYLHCGSRPTPMELRYSWQLWQRPDLRALNAMAACILGERDFGAFASPRDESASRCRYVHAAHFYARDELVVFEIRANAFLWKMVRSLVGSMVHYEAKGYAPEHMRDVLESGDRSLAGPTAPPEGLFLEEVEYDGD